MNGPLDCLWWLFYLSRRWKPSLLWLCCLKRRFTNCNFYRHCLFGETNCYRYNSLSVPPTPLSPRYRYYALNPTLRQSCPMTKPDNPLSLIELGLSRFTFRVCLISLASRISIQNLLLYPSSSFPWRHLIQAQVIGFK